MTLVTVTEKEITNGIYIDFEGNMGMEPTLLGAYFLDSKSQQAKLLHYVHEPRFQTAADSIQSCVFNSIEKTFETLAEMAFREKRLFFAWSSREKEVISNSISNPKLKEFILRHLVDSKKLSKIWKKRFHPDVNFPLITGQGRHRLYEYAKLINYKTPNMAKPGKAGKRLRDVRKQLKNRKNEYLNLTPVAKRKWKNLLLHNEHDCKSMREVSLEAISDLKRYRIPTAA